MDYGKRPGGLTALAVINFVFGGLNVLGLLGLLMLFAVLSAVEGDPEAEELRVALEEGGGMGILVAAAVLSVVTAVLLIASGIGYLKQKAFLGRGLGNIYAVTAIASGLLFAFLLPEEAGGGLNLGAYIGFIYPVVTLILLNTTFRDDFREEREHEEPETEGLRA